MLGSALDYTRHTSPVSDRVTKRPLQSPKFERKLTKKAKIWTVEDDRFLLQARKTKVPYKQIGLALGKSELACRLHHHQMVKPRSSLDEQIGRSIVFMSSEHPPEVHHITPGTPSVRSSISPGTLDLGRDRYKQSANSDRDSGEIIDASGRAESVSILLSEHCIPSRQLALPLLDSAHKSQRSVCVDIARLTCLYKEHARDFWDIIARRYSGTGNPSPTELEQAFLATQLDHEYNNSSSTTPSPMPEPKVSLSTTSPTPSLLEDQKRSPAMGRCSIGALLNPHA